MSWREILLTLLAVGVCVLNIAYWWAAITRWQTRFRLYCERKLGVTIAPGPRGYWQVSGGTSPLENFAIAWLQFVYFVGIVFAWSVAMLVVLGSMKLACY